MTLKSVIQMLAAFPYELRVHVASCMCVVMYACCTKIACLLFSDAVFKAVSAVSARASPFSTVVTVLRQGGCQSQHLYAEITLR